MVLTAGELSLGINASLSFSSRFWSPVLYKLDTFLGYWKYSALTSSCSPGECSPVVHFYTF